MFLKRQQGFGLVELMIGMGISMIILAAASTVLLSSLTSNRDSIRMARLDQELRQVMTMISRDLRRASSWDPAVDMARVSMLIPLTLTGVSGSVTVSTGESNEAGIDHLADIGNKAVGGTLAYVHTDVEDSDADGDKSEVFMYTGLITAYSSGSYTVTLNQTNGNNWPASVLTNGVPAGTWSILRPGTAVSTDAVAGTPGVCLLFNYDINASGTYTDGSGTLPNEFYGYRYDATDDVVEIRTSGASSDTCTTGGTWENLTDNANIAISAFSVANTPITVTSSGMTVSVREFTISITGNLKSDTSVVRTLQETIRVRNDGLT
jgi:type II secretory pathway component PulJ